MSTEQHPLSWIPEILNEIFQHTDLSTLLTSLCVCRQWHSIIKEVDCVKEYLFLQEQERCVKELQTIYDVVHHLKFPFLEPASLPGLCIRCDEMRLNDDGTYEKTPEPCFFDPDVVVYPRVFEDERDGDEEEDYDSDEDDDNDEFFYNFHPFHFDFNGSRHYEESGATMDRIIEGEESASRKPSYLCDEMYWEFTRYPRLHPDGDKWKLSGDASWRLSRYNFKRDSVLLPDFEEDLCPHEDKVRGPVSFYVPLENTHPHIISIVKHQMEERDDLLRGEVLTIAAIILTRLKRFACLYIPVLVFSFMGDFRGRIIQAHFDGTDIIIKKTKLYHFYPVDKARRVFDLFMRQMASTPVGEIRSLSKDIWRESESDVESDMTSSSSEPFWWSD